MSTQRRDPGHCVESPPRLLDQDSAAGRTLRQAMPAYERPLDEPAAWRALQARRARSRRRMIVVVPFAGLALGAAALLLVPRLGMQRQAPQVSTAPSLPPPRTGEVEAPVQQGASAGAAAAAAEDEAPGEPGRAPRLQPGPARRTLAAGRSVLADGSIIRLQPRARAEIRGVPGKSTTVELHTGTIELAVTPVPDRAFEVTTGDVVFRVVGTQFRVSLSDQRTPTLEVSEGAVAVLQRGRLIARVTAGSRWTMPAPAAEPEPEPEQPRPAPPDSDHCLALARQGHAREAISCLEPIAGGSGLSAEMALYETARLQRDVLGDTRAALSTLQSHAARFPKGALHGEVQLSAVDLMARLGRTDEALTLSGQLLQGSAGRERAADLHLLRGNLLRERAGDCTRAEQEYARAQSDRGATGAEATLRRAQCLEKLGRRQEAIEEYEACVRRGQGRAAAEARRLLESLRR